MTNKTDNSKKTNPATHDPKHTDLTGEDSNGEVVQGGTGSSWQTRLMDRIFSASALDDQSLGDNPDRLSEGLHDQMMGLYLREHPATQKTFMGKTEARIGWESVVRKGGSLREAVLAACSALPLESEAQDSSAGEQQIPVEEIARLRQHLETDLSKIEGPPQPGPLARLLSCLDIPLAQVERMMDLASPSHMASFTVFLTADMPLSDDHKVTRYMHHLNGELKKMQREDLLLKPA